MFLSLCSQQDLSWVLKSNPTHAVALLARHAAWHFACVSALTSLNPPLANLPAALEKESTHPGRKTNVVLTFLLMPSDKDHKNPGVQKQDGIFLGFLVLVTKAKSF